MTDLDTVEKMLLTRVRRLAIGVFLVAIMFCFGGCLYLIDDQAGAVIHAFLMFAASTGFFSLGWVLFSKQSYPAAFALTVFLAFVTVFLSYVLIRHMLHFGVLAIADAGQPFFLIETILLMVIGTTCIWVSFRGAKAAKRLKTVRLEIRSELFS